MERPHKTVFPIRDTIKMARQKESFVDALRVGFGYDIHQLVPGRTLVLGGVRIPHTAGLLGHSDADVLLHAIGDALLGAAALGDIGIHFPNTDKRYKNVSSLVLIRSIRVLLKSQNFLVQNIDSTIVLEKPKIARYALTMRKNIASALRIELDRVSVKATTNEGLGHLGAEKGCAAFAVATLRLDRSA
jgi:2-C-methyl-D-erythritol 2,4-cyclodiphosphate synthase